MARRNPNRRSRMPGARSVSMEATRVQLLSEEEEPSYVEEEESEWSMEDMDGELQSEENEEMEWKDRCESMSNEEERKDRLSRSMKVSPTDDVGTKKKGARVRRSTKTGKKTSAIGKENTNKQKEEMMEDQAQWVWGPYSTDEEELGSGMKEDHDEEEDESNLTVARLEETVPPSELLLDLLSFQKQWLTWALQQESGWTKGGILADEMGMGKTIQAISLILANQKVVHAPPSGIVWKSKEKGKQKCVDNEGGYKLIETSATLVICPLVALIQWKNELSRFTKPGSLRVAVYHGPKRTQNANDLANADVVLTTYSTVEVDYRRFEMPPKLPCKWCGKLFHPDRMWVHLKYFCGPDAKKTAAQAKQIRKKNSKDKSNGQKDSKGVSKRSGSRKRGRASASASAQASQTMAETEVMDEIPHNATADAPGVSNRQPKSILHKISWHRVILDEGHCIKDRKSSTAKSVFALPSTYRWALSGTPLQNRVQELYSLVRFLSLDPYSYYFCKKCDCQFLDYSFGPDHKKCDHCSHTPLQHFCWWNRKIANPIRNYGYQGKGREAMKLLREKVLPQILLRRTKEMCADDLELPPRTIVLRRDAFDEREQDFYEALYTQSQSQFDTYVKSGTLLNNYAHIFDLLIRLRQAVNHPYLVVHSQTALNAIPAEGSLDAKRSQGQYGACAVCFEEAEDPLISGCNHLFCRSCAQSLIESCTNSDLMGCPTCDAPLSIDLNAETVSRPMDSTVHIDKGNLGSFFVRKNSILNRINLQGFQSSTKIEALREELHQMKKRDSSAKAIIFSQFTSMLEIIEYRLTSCGIKCAKLLGSMTVEKREKMIQTFTDDPECTCLLISLKAGGVALNLTVASHVMIMDPWWNPAVEQQAQDRIHRLGQYKPIKTVRFVIAGTIEERILKLQEKKQLVFQGTVGADTSSLARLTEDDLRFLFA